MSSFSRNFTIKLKSDHKLTIRSANVEDAQDIIYFNNQICSESNYLNFGEGEYNFTVNQQITIIRNVLDAKNSISILGYIENELAGICEIKGGRYPRIYHTAELSIIVKQKYWNIGIGNSLFIIAFLWSYNNDLIKKISLKVRTDNVHAIKLYEKFGFSSIGILKRAVNIDDRYYDQLLMEIWLSDFKEKFFKEVLTTDDFI